MRLPYVLPSALTFILILVFTFIVIKKQPVAKPFCEGVDRTARGFRKLQGCDGLLKKVICVEAFNRTSDSFDKRVPTRGLKSGRIHRRL